MKKEEIEKAARYAINEHYNCGMCYERDYCEHCYGSNTAYDCQECGADEFKEGFMKGAEWRINSVWHDAEEQPKDWNETCLVELKSGGRSFCLLSNFDHAGGFSCMDGIHNKNIHVIKWAYIKDLLPNMED